MGNAAIWQDGLEWVCTWDIGRRCNLDCSYCPPHRHDATVAHASLQELRAAAELPLRYVELMNKYLQQKMNFHISFTGGEPTTNPAFLDLCRYIKSKTPQVLLGLTTNGVFKEEYGQEVAELFHSVTISYHCEAHSKTKELVKNNIFSLQELSQNNKKTLKAVRVNLMVHSREDLFAECKALAELMSDKGVTFTPRYIGEYPGDPTAHTYTDEQMQFFSRQWGKKNKPVSAGCTSSGASGQRDQLGRPCCGGRSFKEMDEGTKELLLCDRVQLEKIESRKMVSERQFKGWYCLVHLFFLHIQQESGEVYYHQTCKANEKNERGPIGNLSQQGLLLEQLEERFKNKAIRAIICPNKVCNCGLCITKSKTQDVLELFVQKTLPGFRVQA